MPPKKTTTYMTDATIKQLIAQGVANALVEYEANRSSGNGDDNHDSESGGRRTEHTTRECTYSDFLKFQPLNFKGTKGVVATEITNNLMDQKIHAYAERQAENKRKLDTNNQAQQQPPKKQNMVRAYSVGPSEKKEYAGTLPLCNKLEITRIAMIQEVAEEGKSTILVSARIVTSCSVNPLTLRESDEVKKYVGELPEMIQGSVMASKPKTMQDAIEFANELMDQKIRTFTERRAENKRKLNNNSSDNNTQQPPFKRKDHAMLRVVTLKLL
nr:hypothetical protein [Tanacetum cinerariifolium]